MPTAAQQARYRAHSGLHRVEVSLSTAELARLDRLVREGFAANRAGVLRRLLVEASGQLLSRGNRPAELDSSRRIRWTRLRPGGI